MTYIIVAIVIFASHPTQPVQFVGATPYPNEDACLEKIEPMSHALTGAVAHVNGKVIDVRCRKQQDI